MALQSAEVIYRALMNSKTEIVVTREQASEIWQIFRRKKLAPQRFSTLNNRAFMQACLMSAIEGSDAMSWMETLFRSAMKPNATVKGIITALVKNGMQKFYKNKTGAPEELYQNVITTIAWSHKPFFDMIDQGLEI